MKVTVDFECNGLCPPDRVGAKLGDLDYSLPLSALSAETLERMCESYREAVFKKAGKKQPPSPEAGVVVPMVRSLAPAGRSVPLDDFMREVLRTVKAMTACLQSPPYTAEALLTALRKIEDLTEAALARL